ncbi:MAG TPA: hypothetical protein VGF40_04250, partial [Thermoanaerobaculia bacterium]
GPSIGERIGSVAALAFAAWTAFTLRFRRFQHPSLIRNTFRVPDESLPARAWRRLRGEDASGHRVDVELRPESTVWITVRGSLSTAGAEKLAADLAAGLRKRKERLVLDLERLAAAERAALEGLAAVLRGYGDRVRVLVPRSADLADCAAVFA